MFGITIDGVRYNLTNSRFLNKKEQIDGDFIVEQSVYVLKDGVAKINFFKRHRDEDIAEYWLEIENISQQNLKIEEIDTLDFFIKQSPLKIHYFESSWGNEYQPVHRFINNTWEIESKKGRSSSEYHPFIYWKRENEITLVNLAWSGNWKIAASKQDDKTHLRVGLDHIFYTLLAPEDIFEGIHVFVSKGKSLNEASKEMVKYGEDCIFPKSQLLDDSLTVWNHWWAYEDKYIDENVILHNMREAAKLGIEVIVVDSGWFGDGQDWIEVRGDWSKINRQRFPSGLKYLSQEAKKLGMKFGLWCEIEALGGEAEIRKTNPGFAATRNGKDLGYVCLGCRRVKKWAISTLLFLIEQLECEWVKLDFNLDPGEGCDQLDHDHGKGDGLYSHYMGLYEVLGEIRSKFPNLIIENCSSGGLRSDWGMMRHTHVNFLSDPDYGPHQLQVFWGASLIIPPSRCFHFTWSQTLIYENGQPPFPQKNYNESSEEDIRSFIRIASMHRIGLSHPLIEWKDNVKKVVREGLKEYKDYIFQILNRSYLNRLTPQGNRNTYGNEGYQFITYDNKEMLVFLFCFENNQAYPKLELLDIKKDRKYTVKDLDHNYFEIKSGFEIQYIDHQSLSSSSTILHITEYE